MKTFRSFITEEESLLDTHIKYREAGIPLPDKEDITEYPGGKHGYSTGPNTFAVHTITHFNDVEEKTGNIRHYKSTPTGDILHNSHGPAALSFYNGKQSTAEYYLDGYHVSQKEHEMMTKAYTAAGIKHEDI